MSEVPLYWHRTPKLHSFPRLHPPVPLGRILLKPYTLHLQVEPS